MRGRSCVGGFPRAAHGIGRGGNLLAATCSRSNCATSNIGAVVMSRLRQMSDAPLQSERISGGRVGQFMRRCSRDEIRAPLAPLVRQDDWDRMTSSIAVHGCAILGLDGDWARGARRSLGVGRLTLQSWGLGSFTPLLQEKQAALAGQVNFQRHRVARLCRCGQQQNPV